MTYRNLRHALSDISLDSLAKTLQDLNSLGKLKPLDSDKGEVERLRKEYSLFYLINAARMNFQRKGNQIGVERTLVAEKTVRMLIDLAEQQDELEKLEKSL